MEKKYMIKALLPLLFLFLFSVFVYSLERCSGETITPEEVPCLLLVPYTGNCNIHNISFYNSSNFLYTTNLDNFSVNFCNSTFNQTNYGTYTFLYSFGDTGSILLEVDNMIDIFHVLVYTVLGALGLLFIVFMHVFQKDNTSIIYGSLSSVVWILIAVINLGGFELIRNVTFIVDINYYIVALSSILCIYTISASYFFYKENYKYETNPYALRK